MGRIIDLLGDVAATAEEGADGLVLSAEDRVRFHSDWDDEDVNDALALVHDSLLQGELVEASDSLCARLLEILGGFGDEAAFGRAAANEATLSFEEIGQLARRIGRLEEILEIYRDEDAPPDRRGFDELRGRLANFGIETEMANPPEEPDGDSGG